MQHTETLLSNELFFFLKDNECHNQQSLSLKNCLISFCTSVLMLSRAALVLRSVDMKTLFRVYFAKFVLFLFVYLHLFRSVCLTQCKSDDKARMGWKWGEGGEKDGGCWRDRNSHRAVQCLYWTPPLRRSHPRLETNQRTRRATHMPEPTQHYANNAHTYTQMARLSSSQSAI